MPTAGDIFSYLAMAALSTLVCNVALCAATSIHVWCECRTEQRKTSKLAIDVKDRKIASLEKSLIPLKRQYKRYKKTVDTYPPEFGYGSDNTSDDEDSRIELRTHSKLANATRDERIASLESYTNTLERLCERLHRITKENRRAHACSSDDTDHHEPYD